MERCLINEEFRRVDPGIADFILASTFGPEMILLFKMLKHCVNIGMQMDRIGAIDYEAKCFAILMNTEDFEEGKQAFVEKRKPVFKGR